jgi:hypothetical protein
MKLPSGCFHISFHSQIYYYRNNDGSVSSYCIRTTRHAGLADQDVNHLKRGGDALVGVLAADTVATKTASRVGGIAENGKGREWGRRMAAVELIDALALPRPAERLINL